MEPPALERNLALYQWYLPLSRAYFWAPIFFLYFIARFPIDRVLQLESIYYLSVVLLELPSGYLSDRVGRAVTLRLSALGFLVSFILFLSAGDSFALFAAAQAALAFGYASRSGTDESFHFDSLQALGREQEFAAREARLARNGYLVASATAIVGGAAGVWDLRLSYLFSALFAIVLLGVTLRMKEPPREASGWADDGLRAQIGQCLRLLGRPTLAWLFAFVVLQITLEHVPYEFAQPYVAAVLDEPVRNTRTTPLATGLLTASFAFVAAFAAAQSVRLRDRFGVGRTLLGMTAFQTLLIGVMAAVVHPLVLALLLLRSSYSAVSNVIVHAAVTPRVPQAQRATYLSIHSLAGRLGYAAVLFALSGLGGVGGGPVSEGESDFESVARMLQWCAGLALAGWITLFATRRALREVGGPT
ncbi:MAG: hypothetical protein O7G30_01760 [Proteobacteria bacterium]|nr:hypothetical protein [Pseudomonadota bacterium]